MRKILITGGAGNIGGSLARKLVENIDNYVVIVDTLETGSISKLPDVKHKNWKFIKCDVNNYNDIAAVMLSYSFDYVFHYAAVVGVHRTLAHPILVLNDIEGIKNILNVCKNTVNAPTSIANAPKPNKCEEIRANSQQMTRMYWQRGGNCLSMPINFSTANAYATLFASGAK